jgi:hypothetical protein
MEIDRRQQCFLHCKASRSRLALKNAIGPWTMDWLISLASRLGTESAQDRFHAVGCEVDRRSADSGCLGASRRYARHGCLSSQPYAKSSAASQPFNRLKLRSFCMTDEPVLASEQPRRSSVDLHLPRLERRENLAHLLQGKLSWSLSNSRQRTADHTGEAR